MEMDRNSREFLRRLGYEENFKFRQNLTACQSEWEDAFQFAKPFISRNGEMTDMPYMGIAFRLLHGRRSSSQGFVPGKLIVRSSKVGVRFLHRIKSDHWRGSDQNRRYRLNYMEGRFQVEHGAELIVAPSQQEGRRGQVTTRQWDALKVPLQDHCKFELMEYDPHHLIPGDPSLKAPITGTYSLVATDKHLDLTINGIPVYRLEARDGATLETSCDDPELAGQGAHVEKGDKLARLTQKTWYGVAQLSYAGGRPRPQMDRIGGDVLSASRQQDEVRLAAEMMERICKAASLSEEDDERPQTLHFSQVAPAYLAEFDAETFNSLTSMPEWTVSEALKAEMAEACSVNGDFAVRSHLRSAATVYGQTLAGDFPAIETSVGLIVLPKSAQVLDHIITGAVINEGDPVADWLPRDLYPDMGSVLEASGLESAEDKDRLCRWMAKHYLADTAIRPGQEGYTGDGFLLRADLVKSALIYCSDHYVDFRPCAPCISETGDIVLAPIRHDDWTDFHRVVKMIGYDFTPLGDRLSMRPIVADRSPRRR